MEEKYKVGEKTWREIDFEDLFPDRKRNRIIGLSFPANDLNLGLEPAILTVLPEGDNVGYSPQNIDFNDNKPKGNYRSNYSYF